MPQILASNRGESGPGVVHQKRAVGETILWLARHLPPDDQGLLQTIYERNVPIQMAARMLGEDHRTVRKRVRRLVSRLTSPLFRFVVSHRLEWPPHRRAVAEAVLLRGQAQRHTATDLGLSVHRVRLELDRVMLLFENLHNRTQGVDRAASMSHRNRGRSPRGAGTLSPS